MHAKVFDIDAVEICVKRCIRAYRDILPRLLLLRVPEGQDPAMHGDCVFCEIFSVTRGEISRTIISTLEGTRDDRVVKRYRCDNETKESENG